MKFGGISFHDVLEQAKKSSKGLKILISEVIKLLTLIIIIPATNTVSERSFSVMRHLYIFRHQYVAGKTKSHNGFHIHKEKTL